MTRLSVNINKIALIRNSRKGNYPDLIQTALDCERFGADGITVHPRPDQRHIRFSDLPALKLALKTELNIEGNPEGHFIPMVCDTAPAQVTLVPDSPGALTSDHGFDLKKEWKQLEKAIQQFRDAGIRVSLFLDPDPEMVVRAFEMGAHRIELYTGQYSWNYETEREKYIVPHIIAAHKAVELGLGINAGHDLNLKNLNYYKHSLIRLDEVSIGHALICDAIYVGLENSISMYKRCLI